MSYRKGLKIESL